jgi:hypothetical protein
MQKDMTSCTRRGFLKDSAIAAAMAAAAPACGALWANEADKATSKTVKPLSAEALLHGFPPFNYAYHQCLAYKIFCADKAHPDKNLTTFEDALGYIRTIHDITGGGLRQIAYLVGWQFEGHDSKYPAWSEVNGHLKRPQDPDARTSFLWMAEEAKKYNAAASVHINMSDAYENSPLWKEYLAQGLILCDKNGRPHKAGVWGGEQSYLVDKVKEWQTGYSKKRIDAVLRLLPFLRESGTVHIDAFGMTGGNQKLRDAVFGILDYWRAQGIDVTTEYIDFAAIGRIPMVYHLNLSEESRIQYPPNVICGGGDGGNQRIKKTYAGWAHLPEAGCLYEEAWGISIDHDLSGGRNGMRGIVGKICLRTLPWHFFNRRRPVSYDDGAELYRVVYGDGVESTVRKKDRHLTVRHNGRTLIDGGDVFMPAGWTKGEWFAFSRSGGTRDWPVPDAWKNAKSLNVATLTDAGRGPTTALAVRDGKITVSLKAGEGLAISC